MGLCVSKPTVIYRHDEEGYLEKVTFTNPTPQEKQVSKLQRRAMIAEIGRKEYENIEAPAETTLTHYNFR